MEYTKFKKEADNIFRETIWPWLFPVHTELAEIRNVKLIADFVYGDRRFYLPLKESYKRMDGIIPKEVNFPLNDIDKVRTTFRERTGIPLQSFYGETRPNPRVFLERVGVAPFTGIIDRRLVHTYVFESKYATDSKGRITPSCGAGSCYADLNRILTYMVMESPFLAIDYDQPFSNHLLFSEVTKSCRSGGSLLPFVGLSFQVNKYGLANFDTDRNVFNRIKDDLKIPVEVGDNQITVEIKPRSVKTARLSVAAEYPPYFLKPEDESFEASGKLAELKRLREETEKWLTPRISNLYSSA